MVSNAVTRLVFFISIVSALCCYIAQAKPVENDETAERKTYWTIHLLKLKPGAYAYDCDAVLVPPRENEAVQTSQLLLTTVYCLEQRDTWGDRIRIANEKEISALFIERDSNGRFLKSFEMEVEKILIHEDFYTVTYETDVVALIKLKKAVQIPQTMAPIAFSDQPVSNVSRCFVAARPGVRRIYTIQKWNLTNRDVYVNEAGLNNPITLVNVETQLDDQEIKADVLESEEKALLRFTLGSPLVCRHNEVDFVQGLVDEVHYDRGSKYNHRLVFTDVHKFSSWIAQTSEKMMQ